MHRIWIVVALGLAPSLTAHADEAQARQDFEAGERAYNLGDFDKAIVLFRKAYEEWPEPAFLFNIAQTYRQAGDCRQAAFFYKRFLSLKERDTKKPLRPALKAEVEQRIAELEDCVKREIASKPPDSLDRGTDTTTSTPSAKPTTTARTSGADDDEDDDEDDDASVRKATAGQPSLVSVRVGLGAGKLGAGDLDVPVQFAGTLIAGYPLALGDDLQLDLGAAVSFTPVPYETTSGMSGSGSVIGLLANAGAAYTVMPNLAARVDVGIGAQLFAGLGLDGNPFTEQGAPASGALTTFLVRAALSGDYAVTPNVIVTLTPIAFSYSPAPAGFDTSIGSLTTLSFLAGVGYRR
jgi:hypothetical protein